MPLSFTQNVKFANKPEGRLDEFDFTGGLKTDAHETKLQTNQSPDLENVVFNYTGSIKTRNGVTRYNGNPIGASSNVSETGSSTGSLSIDAVGDYVAQTFIPSGTINCLQVDVYLALNSVSLQQYVRVELWSTSGGAPNELLTNGQSQIKLVTHATETAYSFRFKEPVALTTATTYAIIIKPFIRGTTQTVNQVNVYHRADTYANGSSYTSVDAGLNWTNDATKDVKFNVYSGGDTGGTGLIRYYGDGGTQQLFAKIGTALYRGNDITGAMTAVTLGDGVTLSADDYLDWTIVNGTLLVVDGSNYIQKYRGSTNSNYTTGTITVVNGSTSIVGSGTSWATTTNATEGEYIQLPDTKWYKIASITGDTALAIETEYQGSGSSGQSYIISPWGEVTGQLATNTSVISLIHPTPSYIESHANRVWTAEGNTIRFSVLDTSVDEENFNDWDTANNAGSIIIPSGKGDTVTGLYSLNGALFVMQRRAIWGIFGTSPVNFELRNITNEVGLISKRTLVEWNDVLVFLSDAGVYMFDGSNLKNLSDGIVNNTINDWANKTTPTAILWNNSYIIAYPSTGESHNNEALFFDLTRAIWGKMTGNHIGEWSSWKGGTDNGEIYFISSNQGSIYKWDDGTSDDGYEIRTFYSTPSFGFDANVNDKTIKKFYIQQLAKGDYNMSVTLYTDIDANTTTSDINLQTGDLSLWDVAQWDVDDWSSERSILTNRIAEFQGIAKFYKIEMLQEGLSEGIEVLGITITERTRRLI